MKDILPSASYVQNHEVVAAEAGKQALLRSICDEDIDARRLWELLETPQTVESLARLLAGDIEPHHGEIRASLTKLYREDLIQLSPDS